MEDWGKRTNKRKNERLKQGETEEWTLQRTYD